MLPPNRRILTALILTALAAALALEGQQTKATVAQEETGTVFHSDTRLVVCHTTVVDKNGHLVTDLPPNAFTAYENGVQQPIKSVKREDVPVSMGLIIDNSGSMRDKRAKVEAAALALVQDSNPDDEVFIVNFNDEAFLDNPRGKDFTSSIEEMKEALTRIDSRGGTAMRDAIRMSIDHLKEKAHRDKKVLVVVTDGNDNSSVISLEDLVRAAQQSEVLIYSVGLLSDEERRGQAGRAGAGRSGGGYGRRDVLPQGAFQRGPHLPPGSAEHPQPVHHPVHADQLGHGRNVPADQGDGESPRPPDGADAQRLLRQRQSCDRIADRVPGALRKSALTSVMECLSIKTKRHVSIPVAADAPRPDA